VFIPFRQSAMKIYPLDYSQYDIVFDLITGEH